MLVIQSKVKDIAKQAGMRTSDEFLKALSSAIEESIAISIRNAKNGRRLTLKRVDCLI